MTCAVSPFESELRAFEQAPASPQGVVFYGSSSFRLWERMGDSFPGIPVVNRGFGGTTLAECLDLLPRVVFPLRPSRLVLYAGDNDLDQGVSPERLVELLRQFITRFREQCPEPPMAYVSVKPSPSRFANLSNIRRANEMTREETMSHPGVDYLDTFSPMLSPAGGSRPEFFSPDGLHMNTAGYALWTHVIREWLSRETRIP